MSLGLCYYRCVYIIQAAMPAEADKSGQPYKDYMDFSSVYRRVPIGKGVGEGLGKGEGARGMRRVRERESEWHEGEREGKGERESGTG